MELMVASQGLRGKSMPEQSLAAEIAAFEQMHDHLRERFGPHAWVVISGGEFQRNFDRFAEAAMYVAEKFGHQPALVRQVDSPPVHVPYVLMRA